MERKESIPLELSQIAKSGSGWRKQKAISLANIWLKENPNDSHFFSEYLSLLCQGTPEQKQSGIKQAVNWLKLHDSDSEFFAQYLNLIEVAGTQNQRFEAIAEACIWLDNNYDNSNVRTKYLRLVREYGSMKQKQVAIEETSIWLELPEYEENSDVLTQFLTLVEKEGTPEKKKEVITKTDFWLKKYPDKSDVRSKFVSIIKKRGREFSDIQSIIISQWEWINNQKKIDQLLWTDFLPVLKYCDDPTVIKKACESALVQYPENTRIIGICLKHFQKYLPIEISCSLAYKLEKLIDISKLPVNELRPHLLEAANFLRDNDDFNTAEEIYLRLINWSKEKKGKDALETLKKASENYEYLLGLLEEIQEKARTTCQVSRGTDTEEIARAVSREVQKWEISNPIYMAEYIEDISFSLKGKVQSHSENEYLLRKIEVMRIEKDLTKKFQLLSYIIGEIPTIKVVSEETIRKGFNEIKQKIATVDEKIEKINICLKPGIREELIVSVGPKIGGVGFEHTITIPLQEISYSELKEDLKKITGIDIDQFSKLPRKLAEKIKGYLTKTGRTDILEKLT